MLRRRTAFWGIAGGRPARSSHVRVRASGSFAVLVAALAALLTTPRLARAYEEQVSADLALGYGVLSANPTLPLHLTGVDAGAAVGMSDWLVARVGLGYATLLGGDEALHVGRGRLELAYVLDVVQWVPLFGLGGGLWALDDASGLRMRPTGHLWLGVDYLASREWTIGVDVRSGGLWQRGELSSFTEAQVRFSRMFELF